MQPMEEDSCVRKGCEFEFTDDPNDSVLPTTITTSTTMTKEPGCCKCDSVHIKD